MFHRSERLLLRPIWPEDWQAVYEGINDEGIIRNLARAPWPYAPEEARRFTALPIAAHAPRFLITIADTSEVIGCIGLDLCDDPDALELGYWVARPHWGQGFVTEAGRAAISLAKMMGKARMNAGHFIDNPASGRVLEKLGFVRLPNITQRHSRGRGESAASVEYTLQLNA
ncbi:MAG: GNAT family N-acetyltransferase [Marinomonas sp.]